jgi:hypothetical protein
MHFSEELNEWYRIVLGPTNRYSRYNTGTIGVNYQNNLNNHKHDNNSPKEDNLAHKFDPEKLET